MLEQIAPREAANIMRATVHGAAGELRNMTRDMAPEDEGDLVRAIASKRRRGARGEVRSDVVVKRRAFYWRFLEFGTREIRPVGFAAAAFERFRMQRQQVFLRQFVRRFHARLRRVGRGR